VGVVPLIERRCYPMFGLAIMLLASGVGPGAAIGSKTCCLRPVDTC
jgi:hypothetical protein